VTYKTVLLDLDGTLVDSAPGIVNTIAFTLRLRLKRFAAASCFSRI
jgi:phosphoglycolate phosphatase-like HAD superfamily hydrolase